MLRSLRGGPWGLACLAAAVLTSPAVARAAGGGASVAQTRDAVLVLVLVGAAYLLAHSVIDRLQRAFLFVSGAEYLLLGALFALATQGGSAHGEAVESFLPIIALAAGWFGLLRGVDLQTDEFRNAQRGAVKLAVLDDLIPAAFVAIVVYTALRFGFPHVTNTRALTVAGFLAAAAISGSSHPIDVLKRRYHVEGKIVPLLRRATRLGDVGAIVLFGALLAWNHAEPSPELVTFSGPSPWVWFFLSLLLGAVLGGIFTPFLGGDDSENGRFLALVGIITFASGAAYLLDLASLTVNLVLGAVLVNLTREGHSIRSALERTERPMSLVLYVCAGALWVPPEDWETVAVGLVGYLSARLVAKWLAGFFAAVGSPYRLDLFRGMLGQGDIAIAMAVTFRLVFGVTDDLFASAYTVVLLAVVANDIVAPRFLRGLLSDAGHLKREVGAR